MLDDETLLTIDELFGSSSPTDEELWQNPYIPVYSFATYSPGMVRLFVPNNPRLVLRPEVESYGDPKVRHKNVNKEINDIDLDRSIRQSRKTLRELLVCNRFEWFVTFTIAKDRDDAKKSVSKMLNWFSNQRQRNGKFKYVMVAECHKDGTRHFHAVFSGYLGKMVEAINPHTGNVVCKYGRVIYNVAEYQSGFTVAKKIGDTLEDNARVGFYIAKYITKNMVADFGKKRYWCSRGLIRPVKERNPSWYSTSPMDFNIVPDKEFPVPHGKILTYYHLEDKDFPAYVTELLTGLNKL